jgi:hypothetical protein
MLELKNMLYSIDISVSTGLRWSQSIASTKIPVAGKLIHALTNLFDRYVWNTLHVTSVQVLEIQRWVRKHLLSKLRN